MTWRSPYGYNWSENGWRMCDRNECGLIQIKDFTFTDTAPLRKGSPLIILGAWARWFDLNVEEVSSPIWGWSAENAVPNSNHLSGTGIDINAPKHPWGISAQSNFTKTQIATIRQGLRLFEGTVFWGEDWDYDDPMHFQMALKEGNPANDAFANKLLSGYLGIYKASPTTPKPEVPVAVTLESLDAKMNKIIAGQQLIIDQLGPNIWKTEKADLGKNADGSSRYLREAVGAIVKKTQA